MIELHFYPSPNGLKIAMMLEECGLPYRIVEVDILRGAQFAPEFLRISPNNRIPAIVDTAAEGGPLSVFESGAILQYLAEKSGQLLPARYSRPVRSAAMVVLAGRRPRAHGRARPITSARLRPKWCRTASSVTRTRSIGCTA